MYTWFILKTRGIEICIICFKNGPFVLPVKNAPNARYLNIVVGYSAFS